jgi:phosphinothricin acetyltransferase
VDIRLASPDDGPALAGIYRPYVTDSVISFEEHPPDGAEMARRVRETLPAYPWVVGLEGDEIAGYAYAGQHRARAAYRWAVDVSVYVAAERHRQGIGRALYSALFRVLALQGYCRIFAGITLPNAASVGLHEAMGFSLVGVYRQVGWKFGAWHDVGWWQRLPGSIPSPPGEPRTLAELDRQAIQQALR